MAKGASMGVDNVDIAALARAHDEKVAKAQSENATRRRYRNNAGYPFKSEAMGVDPSDILKAQEILKSKGVSTDYTKDGRPIIESRGHLIRHMRAMGFYERNGTTSPVNR
jgi:hypothetical protein